MTLIFQDERCEIWHDDAATVLELMPTESVHLVATDPPYGVAYQSTHRQARFELLANDAHEDQPLLSETIRGCVRVVGQQRHLYVFGPTPALLDGAKVSTPVELIWDKGSMTIGNLEEPWGREHEPIWFAVSKWRHGGKAGRDDSLSARLRSGSIIRVSRIDGLSLAHPTQKPVALMHRLIESSTIVGETVFDPFAGSGTTGVAAILAGRKAILVEVDRDFALAAAARVKQAIALREQIESVR